MKKIYSASITPLTEKGDIDKKSLEKLLNFNLSHGIDGFFFFGTMGEGLLFNDRMKIDLLETAVSVIGKKAKILAGVASTGLNGILENIEKMSKYDCDAYTVIFPGGWAAPKDPVSYIHRIANESDKPVYFYYSPAANGVRLWKEQLEEILSHPGIVGLKNSSDSLKTRKELLLLKKKIEFMLFEGQEWVIDESLMLGCDGAISGMGALGAKLFKKIAHAIDNGETHQAWELQKILIDIFDGVYNKNISTCWIGQKYALKILGIFSSYKTLAPAQQELTAEDKKRIEKCIEKYKSYLI